VRAARPSFTAADRAARFSSEWLSRCHGFSLAVGDFSRPPVWKRPEVLGLAFHDLGRGDRIARSRAKEVFMFCLRCPLCCHVNEVAETANDGDLPPVIECEFCGEVFDAEETRVSAEPES